jgi:elongation factor G
LLQGNVLNLINRRRGTINDSASREDYCTIESEVSLNNMFNFSTELRSSTQGKGEYSMEYRKHQPVLANVQQELITAYLKKKKEAK